MDSTATIIESQPDWLTLTCTDDSRLPRFRAWAHNALAREESDQNKPRRFLAHGYDGTACGRARWGARADGDLVMLSGDLASLLLSDALERATNVSRLDVAVTVRLDPPNSKLESEHYAAYLASPRSEGRRASSTLIQSDDGGATLYVGKRTSDVMLRLYNKAAESGEARYYNCHRYELEIKGSRAAPTATDLGGPVDVAAECQRLVYHWCDSHGIVPAFGTIGGRAILPGFQRRSDAETKLTWLQSAVRPTVDWLRSNGHESRALSALGYDETETLGPLTLPETGDRIGPEGERTA